ncbi:MAG: VCBS repeat-containing protein, partial [Chloroflexi bacterium]|nr:VCBS repeat-containing protein [Chloroflexota bacterium]
NVLPSDNAIWLDYNRDGFLDLNVGNVAAGISYGSEGFALDENDPQVQNKLYHNNGDGTFADITTAMELNVQFQPNLGGSNGGMVAADFNDDGWPDIYVGVFGAPNHLFLSDGQGRFQDLSSGEVGDPGESHNVVSGDIDNDGDLDIIQAAGGSADLPNRSIALLNLGEGQFLDKRQEHFT